MKAFIALNIPRATALVAGLLMLASQAYGACFIQAGNASLDVTRALTNSDKTAIRDAALASLDVTTCDVSGMTDFSGIFESITTFNQNISGWDVSRAEDMSNLFKGASTFNQDLNAWDMSNAKNLAGMFSSASAFNGAIGRWDVSGVTDMNRMFASTSDFNADISAWDVGSLIDASGMFGAANSFTGDISDWKTPNLKNMQGMFATNTAFNGDLSRWDVSSVENFSFLFYFNGTFNGDISRWNVSSGTSFLLTFTLAVAFDQDISGWNVCNASGAGASSFTGSGLDGVPAKQPAFGAGRPACEGNLPEIDVTLAPGQGTLAAVDLGTVTAGEEAQLRVSVKNDGFGDLILSGLLPSDEINVAAVAADLALPHTLAVGESVDMTVSVTPAEAGDFSLTLLLANSDGDEGDLTLTAAGRALPATQSETDDGLRSASLAAMGLAGDGLRALAHDARGRLSARLAAREREGAALGLFDYVDLTLVEASVSDGKTGEGRFAALSAGRDLRETERSLIGIAVGLEASDWDFTDGSAVEKTGLTAAVYGARALGADTYAGGGLIVAGGLSVTAFDNHITAASGATGETSSTRTMATVGLGGVITRESGATFTPSIDATYGVEEFDAFTFSDGTQSAKGEISFGEITIGGEYATARNERGDQFTVGLEASAGFDNDEITLSDGSTFTPGEETSGRLTLGWNREREGSTVGLSLSVGGLGTDEENVRIKADWARDF